MDAMSRFARIASIAMLSALVAAVAAAPGSSRAGMLGDRPASTTPRVLLIPSDLSAPSAAVSDAARAAGGASSATSNEPKPRGLALGDGVFLSPKLTQAPLRDMNDHANTQATRETGFSLTMPFKH